jgi:nucleoside-diphosphate-sugar epimerase
MINKDDKIVITGAAGLVGQNLILLLKEKGYKNLVAIDKHSDNIEILKKLHNDITIVEADLSKGGDWEKHFEGARSLLKLHAQIGSLTIEPFNKNNIEASKNVLACVKKYNVPFTVHISSSVVQSVADDFYTNTKKIQENLVVKSGIPHCVLRPTLMFGWFDRKHFGWLSRYMENHSVFPIPGNGKYMRQPLYVRDFCRVIISAMEKEPVNKVYDITGIEKHDYIDIIKAIKKTKNLKTLVLCIPYWLFELLLKVYALFFKNPPFTSQQLAALVAGDEFEVIPWDNIFNVPQTPFMKALDETFNDPIYSKYILKF